LACPSPNVCVPGAFDVAGALGDAGAPGPKEWLTTGAGTVAQPASRETVAIATSSIFGDFDVRMMRAG
jgi:hypothetical protein